MTISINGIVQGVPSKEDHGPGVQDITELKTVGPSERFDRQERYVEDETRPYYFDLQSVSAESLPDIVEPGDSPAAGRWIRLPQMMGAPALHAPSHTNGTDQIAAVTGAVNGLMIAADKTKLDAIEALAEVNDVFSVHGRVGAVVAVGGDYSHAQLSAIGVDDHHARDHRASHISGGGDAFLATDLLESITKRIETTTGPTTLVVGAVVDGEFLKRVGATIVSAPAGGVDSALVMLLDGTQAMTGTMTTQNIEADGDATRTIGLVGASYATIFTKDLQGGTEGTGVLRIRASDGSIGLEIETGKLQIFKNLISDVDNTQNIGEAGRVFTSGFFRTVEIGTGTDTSLSWSTIQTTVSHAIMGLDTASRIILVTGRDRVASDYNLAVSTTPIMYFADGGAVLTHWTSMTHNGANFVIRTNFGSTEITSTLLTSEVRARVASSLTLSDATGTSVITIADAGDMNLTPTGDVLIGGIKPVLVNGTEPLTAQWNVGDNIISGINALRPDGSSGSKSIGGTGNAWGTVFTRSVQADGGQDLTLREEGGSSVLVIQANGLARFNSNIIFNTDDVRTIGSAGTRIKEVFTTTVTMVGASFDWDDNQSNPTLLLGLTPTTTGNMLLLTEVARIGTVDFTYAVRANPTLGISDGSATIGNIAFLFHDGTDFIIDNAKGVVNTVTLRSSGVDRMKVSSTGIEIFSDLIPGTATNTRVIGSGGLAYANVFTRIVQPDTGSLLLRDAASTAAITIANAGDMTFAPSGDIITATNFVGTADAAQDLGKPSAVFGTLHVRVVRPDVGQNLVLRDKEGDEVVTIHGDETVFNDPGANRNWRVESEDDPTALTVDGETNRVGSGVALNTAAAKLHVKQPVAAEAIPVLALEQLDIDDSFINFIGTSAADSSRSISSSVATAAAKVGAFLCELNGVKGWVRMWASAV